MTEPNPKPIDNGSDYDSNSIKVLKGLELEVKADGTLNMSGEILERLDICLASTHTAQKQPRDSQAARTLRTTAIQLALRHATDVPLSIMRLSAEALTEAHSLAPRIHRSTIADVTVAVMLLRAGFEGAQMTVDANLSGLADAEHATTVRDECGRLSERAAWGLAEAERLLRLV